MMTNDLPLTWKWVKLGDVCSKISNGANAKQTDEKIGFPISRIETIWNEKIDLDRVKYIHENNQEFIEKYSLKENDILFSHINSDIHLGKTAIFKNQTKTLIHGINLLLIRFNSIVIPDFFNYQFKFKRRNGEFIRIAQKSVNQSSINQPKLKNVDFVLPPYDVQQAIVSKIEELFSELDKGIENLKIAQQQLKVYRQAVLKYAFEGLEEEQTIQDITLESLIGLVRSNAELVQEKDGAPYIKMNNVDMDGRVNNQNMVFVKLNEPEKEKYSLRKGDILINTRNSFELVGKTGYVENIEPNTVFNNNLLRIRVKASINSKFICYQMISPWFRKQMVAEKKATTNVCALYQRDIFPLKVKIASVSKQNKIVEEIESRLSVADKMEENIKQSLLQSESLRQSILKKAFEGTLI